MHTLLCEHTQENTLEYGAVWMMFYPDLMIEHYPNAIVVSQVIPQGVDRCSNIIEFYFPEKMLWSNHLYCLAFKTAYLETAAEDDEMCEKIHVVTKIYAQLDYVKAGPIQPILEAGV